jgi:hypothetical protein
MANTGTYVYAVASGAIPSSFRARAVGGRRGAVRIVRAGPLGAVVSDAPRDAVALNRENLHAHSETLQELLETASAVVPIQFGTVFPDDAAVRNDLLSRTTELNRLLDRVDNRVEFRLKTFYVEDVVLTELLAEDRRVRELQTRTRGLSPDAAYYDRIQLGELIAAGLAAKRAGDGKTIVRRLAAIAVDHVVDEPGSDWCVVAASFLVDRSATRRFEAASRELADGLGARARIRCVGPLPPYSFVDMSLQPLAVA